MEALQAAADQATRTCLAFAVILLTAFPAGVRTWDLTQFLFYLYTHSLPQPPKHSAITGDSDTCTGSRRRPRVFCLQSFHDLHCQTGRNTFFFFLSQKSNNLFLYWKITKFYLDQPTYARLRALHASVAEICIKITNAKMIDCSEE